MKKIMMAGLAFICTAGLAMAAGVVDERVGGIDLLLVDADVQSVDVMGIASDDTADILFAFTVCDLPALATPDAVAFILSVDPTGGGQSDDRRGDVLWSLIEEQPSLFHSRGHPFGAG